jgi:Mn2+/Fe2+ NRAMP family transporter
MRSAADVISALLAAVFVAIAVIVGTGVGLPGPSPASDAAPIEPPAVRAHHDH